MKGTKAVGYARVVPLSTSDEALAHQAQRIEGYCRANEFDLVRVFEETVSAEISNSRTVLQEALKAVPDQGILVVVRVDRIGGNKRVLKDLQDECAARGISVHTMQGPVDLSQIKSSIEVTVIS